MSEEQLEWSREHYEKTGDLRVGEKEGEKGRAEKGEESCL